MSLVPFFLSYARDDDKTGVHIRRLFEDLRNALADDHFGEDLSSVESFIDARIETGSTWETDILRGIGIASVFVPLFSPRYFRRDWCAREWGVFHARMNGGSSQAVLPICWIP